MGSPAVSVERKNGGYIVATICKEPVNSMNLAMWLELTRVLEEAEADPAIRGLIWASGLKRDVFTAGNDLNELHFPATSRERHCAFWLAQTRFLARLYKSPLVTIAAVRGACPAGGCCLALACDIRLASDNCTIGLNEVALGIPVPVFWAQLMVRVIGPGAASQQLLFAKMASATQAAALGMVEQPVPSQELLPAAEAAMAAALKLPDYGRCITKAQLNSAFANEWEAQAGTEAESAWTMLESPSITAAIGAVLARLKKQFKPAAKL